MKNLIILVSIVLFLTQISPAQQRARVFENYDTSNFGVVITYQQKKREAPVEKPKQNQRPRLASSQYPPSPPYGDEYKNNGRLIERPYTPLVNKTGLSSPTIDRPYSEPFTIGTKGSRYMNTTNSHLRGHSTGDALVDAFIMDSSHRYKIDPLLIFAQMAQESSFKKRALSHKGASGLMQLMPATARRLGVTNIYDPQQNIDGGVKYMRMLLNMFDGNVDLALAGYNAGEGAVIKYGHQIPPYAETRDYVKRISSRYRSISASYAAVR